MAGKGKEIVLITGANTGLGFEIAKKLLRDHGERFYVLIGARTPSKGEAAVKDLQGQGFKNTEFLPIEVTNNDSVAEAAKIVDKKFGRLDVLHANAGIAPDKDKLGKVPLSDLLMETFHTNVAGAAQTAEAFVPLLQKADNPRIIFMSTGLGSLQRCSEWKDSLKTWPAYATSKAGLNMVMLYFSHSYPNMKINACSPGFRATALNNFGQGGGREPGKTEDGANNAVRLTLLEKDSKETGTHTDMDDATGKVATVPW